MASGDALFYSVSVACRAKVVLDLLGEQFTKKKARKYTKIRPTRAARLFLLFKQ